MIFRSEDDGCLRAAGPGVVTAGPLVLVPLSRAAVRDLLEHGRLPEPLRAGEGWPHDDTHDGLCMAEGGASFWLVVLDGVVIGDCGATGGADEGGDLEIGYGLAAPFRGRGYGNAIVAALAAWGLAQPGVRRVVARVTPGNVASCRVLERAGFRRVGESEGELQYVLPTARGALP